MQSSMRQFYVWKPSLWRRDPPHAGLARLGHQMSQAHLRQVIIIIIIIHANTQKFGWSYTLNTIHKNHCLSWHCSHETLFILVVFTECTIHKNSTITEKPITIHTVTIHYSCWRKLLTMQVVEAHIPDLEYTTEHDHAVEKYHGPHAWFEICWSFGTNRVFHILQEVGA